MKRIFAALAMLLLSAVSHAADLAPAMSGEVSALFNDLENSGCKFNRNGNWYSGAEARAHLQKKYDYLFDKGKIATTEEFIVQGASQSSMSGTPYQVQCPGDAQPQPSALWLHTELKKLRAAVIKAP